MADEFDDWQTGSGLLTDYEGTVISAEFATDVNYQQGIPYLLFLTFGYVDKDSGETHENIERYSVGADWKSFDGGMSVEHPKGATHRINTNSQYGKLINAAIEAGGGDVLKKRGSAKRSEVWVGTQWKMDEVTNKFNIDGRDIESTKNYPSKFLGTVDGGQGKVEAPSASSDNGSGPLEGVDDTLVAEMTKLAQEMEFGAWVDASLGLTGVADNSKLVVALADEAGLYTQLRG